MLYTGLPSDVYFFTFLSCFVDDGDSFSPFLLLFPLKYDKYPQTANGTPIPNAAYIPDSAAADIYPRSDYGFILYISVIDFTYFGPVLSFPAN